uniref:TSA: Wollemia nobilis Ref_Wollemi_Transcript_14309_1211 transcribed RNA sequence n=1 Tax=Wollemia nobilis TaxID=56998 RepID=A0A0C9RSZ4_9CONI
MASAEAKEFGSLKQLVDAGLQGIPEAYIRPENERPTATPIFTESVPVIDIQGLYGPNRAHIVDAINKASQEWGFFQVINHSVPKRVIERMVEAHHRFFDLPEEEKIKYRAEDLPKPATYGTSFSVKCEKIREWRDFLSVAVKDPVDAETLECWPPVIRDAGLEYSAEMKKLAVSLFSALSEGLGMPGILENIMGYGRFILTYYPPCPNPDMTFGISGHSDVSLLTILLQDDVGGLQVMHSGRWVAVQPISGAFVINIGDTLQVLSNGRFQSVEHRAVATQNRARMSIPFFCFPDNSTVIKPISEIVDDHNPPRYRSFTFGEYMHNFFNSPLSGKAESLAFARIS